MRTRNTILPDKRLACLAGLSLVLALSACGASPLEQPPIRQVGAAGDAAAVLRCQGDWYLSAGEDFLPSVWLNSVLTQQPVQMAAFENTGTITDAIYQNGELYAVCAQAAESENTAAYHVYRQTEEILQGVCGSFASQAPAFARLQDGTVLVVQDQQEGFALYQIPDHASKPVTKLPVEAATLISVTPKAYQNRICLLAEREGGARFIVHEIDFDAGSAAFAVEIPLEQAAGLIGYALTENGLVLCQQTAKSAETTPRYELLVYQTDTGELVKRQSLGGQPVYPLSGLPTGGLLCQDDAGRLFLLDPSAPNSRRTIGQVGVGPFAVHTDGSSCYLVNANGDVYALADQTPQPTTTAPATPELTYDPKSSSTENQYAQEGGMQVLVAYGNSLLPDYEAEEIYAFYEPAIDLFNFTLTYQQDGKRYYLMWLSLYLSTRRASQRKREPVKKTGAKATSAKTEAILIKVSGKILGWQAMVSANNKGLRVANGNMYPV